MTVLPIRFCTQWRWASHPIHHGLPWVCHQQDACLGEFSTSWRYDSRTGPMWLSGSTGYSHRELIIVQCHQLYVYSVVVTQYMHVKCIVELCTMVNLTLNGFTVRIKMFVVVGFNWIIFCPPWTLINGDKVKGSSPKKLKILIEVP